MQFDNSIPGICHDKVFIKLLIATRTYYKLTRCDGQKSTNQVHH